MPMTESNSPALGHAPKPNKPETRLSIWSILLAIVVGIITGVVGTVMHLNSFWTGSFGIPWGVALALLIAGLAQWWIGLRTAHMLAPGITGLAQYVTLAVMALFSRGDTFTVPVTAQTWEFVPHLVLATLAWHLGILVLTIWMVRRVNRIVKRTRAQLTRSPDMTDPTVTVW